MRFLLIVVLSSVLLSSVAHAVPNSEVDSSRYSGYVIALAWPKAWAKEAGDGYDRLMRGLGFNDGGFYRVGHAALILVDASDGSCHYFDFGRYHTPVGMGRVRDDETDHELVISTKAQMEGKRILNLDAILCEVQSNVSTHASGPMYASYVRIDFASAHAAAKEMQQQGMLPYGPFEKDGSNCSRFVRQIILAGEPNWAHALRLEVVPMITPTTLFPVSALYHWTKVPGCLDQQSEEFKNELSSLPDSLFHGVLPEPERPIDLSETAQWLAGESSGSWFDISSMEHDFVVTRIGPSGVRECSVRMQSDSGADLNLSEPFEVIYPSHCQSVTLKVDGDLLMLSATSK